MRTLLLLISALLATATTVAADSKVFVVDPPITNHLVLQNGPLPPVCKATNVIMLRASPGEYEPASFVVDAALPLKAVDIKVGQLTGNGTIWPKEAVDVRVVKELYRRRYGGAGLIPTLLVHDDNVLAMKPAPTDEEPDWMNIVARKRDAGSLQPLDIPKRRQFWLTVHVPENAAPGTYRTTVRVIPAHSPALILQLEVEVYPFKLTKPILEYSIYYPAWLESHHPDQSGRFGYLTNQQYVKEIKNMLAHGLSNPNIYGGIRTNPDGTFDFSNLQEILELRESAGMRPKHLYLVSSPIDFEHRILTNQQKQVKSRKVELINAWARQRGYEDIYYMARDEQWGEQLSLERDSMAAVRNGGGKVFTAVLNPKFFDRVGDLLNLPILTSDIGPHIGQAGSGYGPDEALRHMDEIAKAGIIGRMASNPQYRKAIDGAHRFGHQIYTYMNPPSGVPLPDLQRRTQGLGLWRVGFDGTMNWAYAHIQVIEGQQVMWHQLVYRLDDGVLDTLHYEGFREGVDDVRYLSTLLEQVGKASGTTPGDPLITETVAWLAKINVDGGDLDGIRREMARRITALLALGYQERTPQELLTGIDLDQVRLITFPEPWQFKIDPDDQGVEGKWFDPKLDDSKWATVRSDKVSGWEKQGFDGKQSTGYGWYRAALPLAAEDLGTKYKYLYFEAVDEDAWLYLSGRPFFEHTLESSGLLPEEIWLEPFTVDLADAQLKGADPMAVRVLNRGGMGGIWKPVHLILSAQKLSSEQLGALVKLQTDKKD